MKTQNNSATIYIVVLCILCFLQFCAILWFGFRGQSFNLPNLSYADFLTVIFTAVTLILSMLAIMLGLLAFVGWQGFQSNVHRLTTKIIQDGFQESGEFREVLKEEVDAIATSGISPISDLEQIENEESD